MTKHEQPPPENRRRRKIREQLRDILSHEPYRLATITENALVQAIAHREIIAHRLGRASGRKIERLRSRA